MLAHSSPPAPTPALGALRKNLAQLRIFPVLVDMVYANMPMRVLANGTAFSWSFSLILPLQIIGPRVLVLAIGTEGADIARRCMNETVPYHFVLPLETLPTLTARTAGNRTIMRSTLRVYVGM